MKPGCAKKLEIHPRSSTRDDGMLFYQDSHNKVPWTEGQSNRKLWPSSSAGERERSVRGARFSEEHERETLGFSSWLGDATFYLSHIISTVYLPQFPNVSSLRSLVTVKEDLPQWPNIHLITWSQAEVPGFGLQNTFPWEAQFNQPQRSLHQCPCFSAGLRRRRREPGREPIHQCPIPSHLYLLPKQHSDFLAGPQSSTIVTSFEVPHSSWNELFNQNTNLIMAEPT